MDNTTIKMNGITKKSVTIEPPFIFKNGAVFNDPITIAYETLGTLNDKKNNAILVTTGLSPSAHIASSIEIAALVGGRVL
ncbi:MAG: hypothetical protein CM1200mP17_12890 [Woeseia sp.]|nr:MAG: hypothetical protein CM1200mP17_12890 [Woeseia sp.]